MRTYKPWLALLASLVMYSFLVSAQTVKTDWLVDQEGSIGGEIGAEVIHVSSEKDVRLIDIRFPKAEMYDLTKLQIQVFSEDEQEHKLFNVKRSEPLVDGQGKPYGLRVKLKNMKNFEFRLYLHQNTEIR